jgi:hypothetical protein
MKLSTFGGVIALGMLAVLSTTSTAGPLLFGGPGSRAADENPLGTDVLGISDPYPNVVDRSIPDQVRDTTQGRAVDIRGTGWTQPPAQPVPEPHSMWLLGSSMLGLAGFRVIRRRRD